PHNAHTYWLGCENCHPAIFVMGKGKNKMSMVEISEGKWCGRCHGKVAFPLTDCSRCHTQKKG
ncbi:MAG TPA: cytochrome C, partial [Gammaproteobacteria bacterium]|nr:cytochrome C [Gammaproteobacteria bacterium]